VGRARDTVETPYWKGVISFVRTLTETKMEGGKYSSGTILRDLWTGVVVCNVSRAAC